MNHDNVKFNVNLAGVFLICVATDSSWVKRTLNTTIQEVMIKYKEILDNEDRKLAEDATKELIHVLSLVNCVVQAFLKSADKEGKKQAKGFRKMLESYCTIKSKKCSHKRVIADYALQLNMSNALHTKFNLCRADDVIVTDIISLANDLEDKRMLTNDLSKLKIIMNSNPVS